MIKFLDTELILTPEKRVYHLNLRNEDIADDVLLVGDQNRVAEVSKYFDKIEFKSSHREFITHTGTFNGKRITVLSTGIGTDNIDIVLNELDAAVNIDPEKRELKATMRKLRIYRLGTSGSLQADIPVNGLVASAYGLGLDGLLHFYEGIEKIDHQKLTTSFISDCSWPENLPRPYCIAASENLLKHFKQEIFTGITATAPGFYGPQGREIRLKASAPNLNEKLTAFRFADYRITNFEMETSALYGLGKLLNHECLTVCVIIANRIKKEFSTDYHQSVNLLIKTCLNKISEIK